MYSFTLLHTEHLFHLNGTLKFKLQTNRLNSNLVVDSLYAKTNYGFLRLSRGKQEIIIEEIF